MSGAQVWTVIGGFFAILTALVGLVLRVVRAEVAVLREQLDGLRNELLARFDALDRDVQRLYRHVFERQEPPAA
jgi:hypothetical protein